LKDNTPIFDTSNGAKVKRYDEETSIGTLDGRRRGGNSGRARNQQAGSEQVEKHTGGDYHDGERDTRFLRSAVPGAAIGETPRSD